MLALHACNKCKQYTIRNIPDTLDAALRHSARQQGKSPNEVAVEALARGAGVTANRKRHAISATLPEAGEKIPSSIALWLRRTQSRISGGDQLKPAKTGRAMELSVRVALDTSRYTDLCRGDRAVVEVIELADEVWLPFIVIGELRAGFAVGTQGPRNDAILRRFLLKPGVAVLCADEQTTHHYANIYRQLRKQGTPIPTNMTCGSPHSYCNTRSRSMIATHTSILCRNSRGSRPDRRRQLTIFHQMP